MASGPAISLVDAIFSRRGDLVFRQGELRDSNGPIIGCRALGTFADLTLLGGD